jgi:RNA polymerase sigma-70 factor (ECF subfamily)
MGDPASSSERPAVGASAAPAEPLSVRQLYAEQGAFVWRSLRRLGVPEADLPDICQDVFLVVHRKLETFDQRSAVKTWLFGICMRVAADFRRRAHVRREVPVEQVPDSAVSPSQGEAVQRQQARAVLDRILDSLDEDKRAVFILYELEQWAMADIATAVGCPVQTAYSRLAAARKHVETAIAHESGGEPA